MPTTPVSVVPADECEKICQLLDRLDAAIISSPLGVALATCTIIRSDIFREHTSSAFP
jgi:hypothetical protein